MKEQTLGEKRAGVTFNPSNSPKVDEIKKKTAELIDLVEGLRTEESTGEQHRVIALASTGFQQAKMWAVEAVFTQ